MSRALLGGVAIAALSLSACASDGLSSAPPPTPSAAPASVHLATLTVVPWQDIAPTLQPKFDLSEGEALKQAIAVSSKTSSASSVADQFFIDAAIAGQTVDSERKVETKDGLTTVSETKTTALKTPAAPNGKADNAGAAGGGDAGAGNSGSAAGASGNATPFTPTIEAVRTYQLATALFQEARILNRYVGGVTVYPGYTPYLVRLQLTVFPNERDTTYDTTVTLRFYQPACLEQIGCVKIVPLLVTESLEGTSESASVKSSSSAGGEIGWTQGVFGIGAGASHKRAKASDSATVRPNSLFAIAKVDESTLKVRLGANRFGDAFEMLPRNHTVSVVIYVRDQVESVTVKGYANFVDATRRLAPTNDAPILTEQFYLPVTEKTACPPPQMVTLTDNGTEMTGSMGNAFGFGLTKIYGRFFASSIKVGDRPLTLQSKSATVNGNNIMLTFPSASALMPKDFRGPLTGRLAFSYFSREVPGPSQGNIKSDNCEAGPSDPSHFYIALVDMKLPADAQRSAQQQQQQPAQQQPGASQPNAQSPGATPNKHGSGPAVSSPQDHTPSPTGAPKEATETERNAATPPALVKPTPNAEPGAASTPKSQPPPAPPGT